MDEGKPVPVVNLLLESFVCVTTNQGIKGIIQGYQKPEISVSGINILGVTVEETLFDIVMDARNVVITMECDGEASWEKSLGEL